MSRLIILEGTDGSGKSTQAKMLAAHLGCILIQQPSSINTVGFLRAECKHNPDHQGFERQLLHTISHAVDVYELFDSQNIVMDRCWMSGIAYSVACNNESSKQLDLLFRINAAVHQQAVLASGYEVDIVYLNPSTSYKSTKDDDVYESSVDLNLLKDTYARLMSPDHILFGYNERKSILNLNPTDTEEEVHKALKEMLHV